MRPEVAGYCPMGCGDTLFVADGGYITCHFAHCPRPTAVADLLEDSEQGHLVKFTEDNWTVRHPLRERLDDAMLSCSLAEHIGGLQGPPVAPGTYRVLFHEGQWVWNGPVPVLPPEPREATDPRYEGPLDRVPSHRSTDEFIYIQIDRLNYRVRRGIRTGGEIRAFATPPIGVDRDLWLTRPGQNDLLVGDHMGVDLGNGGLRFWTTPKIINAGSDSRVSEP